MSRRSKIDPTTAADSGLIQPSGGGGAFWTSEDVGYGTHHLIRVMPALDGQPRPWTGHAQHWVQQGKTRRGYVIPSLADDKHHPITCTRVHGDGKCVICDLVEWDKREKNGQLKGYNYKAQYYLNIIVFANPRKPSVDQATLKVWGAPASIPKRLEELTQMPHWGERLFEDEGYNIDFHRTGSATGPLNNISYKLEPIPEIFPMDLEEWEDDAATLADFISIYDEEIMVEAVQHNLAGLVPVDEILGVRSRAATTQAGTRKKTTTKKSTKTTTKKTAKKGKRRA